MRPYNIFFFLVLSVYLSAQQKLQTYLNDLNHTAFFKHAVLGVSVRTVSDHTLTADLAKDKLFIPASTLKLVTTLTAKNILGDGFKFVTKIYHDGIIYEDGTLHGSIYIIGNGDPSLGGGRIPGNASMDEVINKVVVFIRQLGILKIQGKIISIVPSTDVSPIVDSWQWNDIGNYYATGLWPININENFYNIYFDRDKNLNDTATIAYIEPFIPELTHRSYVTIDSSHKSDNAYIFGTPFQYKRYVNGSIPQGKGLFKIRGSLPDPPLFFAYKLYTKLAKAGIEAQSYATSIIQPSNLVYVGEHLSPTLNDLIKVTNEKSHNLYAEGLLHALGGRDTDENIERLTTFLNSLGIDHNGFLLSDGSGLSTKNLMSPDALTTFLVKFAQILPLDVILNLLPKVGESGTVINLLSHSPAKGKMWVKSGSMENILCYAGYAQGKSGHYVAFTVFLNGSISKTTKENKIELEKILDAIYNFS